MSLKERIEELIKKLEVYRESVFENYVDALDLYDPKNGSMEAVERAGILYDLDKHITNLHLEVQREKVLEMANQTTAFEEVSHV